MSDFFQAPPTLGNQYDDDRVLQSYLLWKIPVAFREEIMTDLRRLGQRVVIFINWVNKQKSIPLVISLLILGEKELIILKFLPPGNNWIAFRLKKD